MIVSIGIFSVNVPIQPEVDILCFISSYNQLMLIYFYVLWRNPEHQLAQNRQYQTPHMPS